MNLLAKLKIRSRSFGLHWTRFFTVGLLILSIVSLGGCQPQNENLEQKISVLRIGVLPDESEEKLLKRYQPLIDYLAQEIGIPCEWVASKTYGELLSNIHSGKMDFFYLGGVTFIHSYKKDKVIPLVMRDIDTRFTSYFLVSSDNPAQSLKDLRGKTFSFGSKFSTSGHYMGRYYLEKKGILAEQFF